MLKTCKNDTHKKWNKFHNVREDLKIYQSKSLESTFVQLINEKQINCIVGVSCIHLTMDTSQFTDNKLNDLLDKISRESKKKVYLTSDFNFDLLKISSNTETSNFYDKVTCNLLFPLITLPTTINEQGNTLIGRNHR